MPERGPSRELVEKAADGITRLWPEVLAMPFDPERGNAWARKLVKAALSAVWPALVEEARREAREKNERLRGAAGRLEVWPQTFEDRSDMVVSRDSWERFRAAFDKAAGSEAEEER